MTVLGDGNKSNLTTRQVPAPHQAPLPPLQNVHQQEAHHLLHLKLESIMHAISTSRWPCKQDGRVQTAGHHTAASSHHTAYHQRHPAWEVGVFQIAS